MFYEMMCMALAIYFEARGEPLEGQVAVGQVIMNRVEDPRYPSDACSVVYEAEYYSWNPELPIRNRCQFSFYCDGQSDNPGEQREFERCVLVASAVLNKETKDVVRGATHYHTTRVQPHWAEKDKQVRRIAKHVFYAGIL